MVVNDLRFYFCCRLEFERAGFCDRSNGGSFESRTDEANCGATPLSRSWKAAVGASNAVGLLRLLAVSDHLVRQSTGRDWLVSQANSWRLGRDSIGNRHPAFRSAFPVFAVEKLSL